MAETDKKSSAREEAKDQPSTPSPADAKAPPSGEDQPNTPSPTNAKAPPSGEDQPNTPSPTNAEPVPTEESTLDSAAAISPVKPYVEAIDAKGVRVQKICLLAIAALTVLFFALLLPSLGTLEAVRNLRANQTYISSQIDIYNRKAEARRGDPASAARREKGVDCLPAFHKTFNEVRNRVADLEDDFESQVSDRNRKESLTKFVREKRKDSDEELRKIDEYLKKKDNECSPKEYPGARDLRNRLAFLKLRAQQVDVAERLSAESARSIPLGVLGVFGLKLDGLNEARIPLLYLPILWSALLLTLLFYASQARSSMLTMYARALRAGNESALLKELGPQARSTWWWLAPLPRLNGSKVSALELKSSLGWKRFELVAFLAVIFGLAGLFAMQVTAVLISWRVSPLLTGGAELSAILTGMGLLALGSATVIFLWLWPWRRVPDFDANEEGAWHYRRTVVSMLVLGLAGILLIRRVASEPERPRVSKFPRFRRKRTHKSILLEDIPVSLGFYQNTCSSVVHYVSLRRFPIPAQPRQRRKRRRIRLLRIETARRRRTPDAGVTNGRLPPRLRDATLERRPGKPEKGNPNDLVVRDVWEINWTKNMKSFDIDNFLQPATSSGNEVAGESRDSSKNAPVTMPAPKRDQADMNGPKTAEMLTMRHDTPRREWTRDCGTAKTRVNSSQAGFAIEQEALRRLDWIKKKPNISSEEANSIRDGVFALLKNAIPRYARFSPSRLHDLLAVLALRNNREDILNWLIDQANESGSDDLKARAVRWASKQGAWRKRWSLDANIGYKHKRKEWSGLPM